MKHAPPCGDVEKRSCNQGTDYYYYTVVCLFVSSNDQLRTATPRPSLRILISSVPTELGAYPIHTRAL